MGNSDVQSNLINTKTCSSAKVDSKTSALNVNAESYQVSRSNDSCSGRTRRKISGEYSFCSEVNRSSTTIGTEEEPCVDFR